MEFCDQGHYFHDTLVKVSQLYLMFADFRIQHFCYGAKFILKSKIGLNVLEETWPPFMPMRELCQAITNLPMFDRCICLMSSVLSRNTSCSAAFSTARLQRQRNMTHLYDFKIFHKGLFILVIDSFSNLQTVTTTRWPHGNLSAQYCH